MTFTLKNEIKKLSFYTVNNWDPVRKLNAEQEYILSPYSFEELLKLI